jgi:hypothetical protein
MYLVAYRRVSVGVFPSIMVFRGGPRSGTNHFRLESGFIRFSPCRLFFCRALSGPVCPFQCQALERWLELLPGRGCMAHSAGKTKRTFASCAKRYLLQLDASSHLLDAAVFNRHIFTLSLELASGRLLVPPFGRRFRRSDPWRSFLVLFHKWMSGSFGDVIRLGAWSGASAYFRSFHVL